MAGADVRFIVIFLWLLMFGFANGQQRSVSQTGTGRALINVGPNELTGGFINFLEAGALNSTNAVDPFPRELDNNGYPNNIEGGSGLRYSLSLGNVPLPANDNTYDWVVSWRGTCGTSSSAPGLRFLAPTRVTSGRRFVAGATIYNLSLYGTNGSVTFSFRSSTPSLGTYFLAGAKFSGCAKLALYRQSDAAAYAAGQIFTPEFLAALKALNPLAIRTMPWNFDYGGNANNFVDWQYRTPTSYIAYGSRSWPNRLWAGTTRGTDRYSIGPAPNTPATWTDGEQFQAFIPNAGNAWVFATAAASGGGVVELTVDSTSTLTTNQTVLLQNCGPLAPPTIYQVTVIDGRHLTLQGSTYSSGWSSCATGYISTTTINVNGRGAKFVVPNDVTYNYVSPIIGADTLGTFQYDALLNVVIFSSGGMTSQVPYEVQAALANQVGSPLWFNFAPHVDNATVAETMQFFSANLASPPLLEWGNEMWNGAFPNFAWGYWRGVALGLSGTWQNYYGLRFRQIMGIVAANWSRGGLHRMNCGQEYGPPSSFNTYDLQGTGLCGSSCGNSAYQSLVGTDYNASPNRPGDFTDGVCIAIYVNGSQTAGSSSSGDYGGNTYAGISTLISEAAAYATGVPASQIAALQWLDSDYRNGTGGASGQSTLSYVSASIYPAWVSMLTTTWPGMTLYAYEGGMQAIAPGAAWLASQGDTNSTTDAANIANLIVAYDNSRYAFSLAYDYGQQFLNAGSIVKGSAELSLQGPSQWSLLPGLVIPSPPLNAYQMYWGICSFNRGAPCAETGGWLLRRDLNPASNDNTPLGLDAAA
jgi:hypothetical protein